MKTMTIQQVGLCVDAIYANYSKSKISQKNTNQLASDCGISVAVVIKIKKILANMKILIIEGERAAQTCSWNPCKCKPNDTLLREVYKIYTSDAKTRVKVENKKRSSLEGALEVLVKAGWEGIIKKIKVDGIRTITETIDLSKIELWNTFLEKS